MSNRCAEGERSNAAVTRWQRRRTLRAAHLYSDLAGIPLPHALATLGRLNYFEHAHILALLEDEANPLHNAPRTSGDRPAIAAVFAVIDNPAPTGEGETARILAHVVHLALAAKRRRDTGDVSKLGTRDTGEPPRVKPALILLRGSQEPNAPTRAHQGATRHLPGVASLGLCTLAGTFPRRAVAA